MTDYNNSLISELFKFIDGVAENNVAAAYHSIVSHYAAFFWSMAAVYIGLQFYRAMQGMHSYHHMLDHVVKVVIILTFAMNYHYFCLFIYDLVEKEPLELFGIISNNKGATIGQALDQFLNDGVDFSGKIFLQGCWYNGSMMLTGVGVFLATVISIFYSAAIIIFAKCASIVILSLSPLFIFAALFNLTRGMFEAYMRMLLTYALVPVLASATIMILYSLSHEIIAYSLNSKLFTFVAIVPFLGICFIQFYLMTQVVAKAASLGGGFCLASFMSTIQHTRININQGMFGRLPLTQSDVKKPKNPIPIKDAAKQKNGGNKPNSFYPNYKKTGSYNKNNGKKS